MKTMAYADTNQTMNDNDGRPGKFFLSTRIACQFLSWGTSRQSWGKLVFC